jgi:hypothetical protein
MACYLLPHLVAFATNTTPEDPESARSLISHTLTTYTSTLSSAQKPIYISLLLPSLLKRASGELEGFNYNSEKDSQKEKGQLFKETSTRLLELAAADQTAFRGVVAGMTAEQKGFMESVILAGRSAAQGQKVESGDGGNNEPSIALRMDFGV